MEARRDSVVAETKIVVQSAGEEEDPTTAPHPRSCPIQMQSLLRWILCLPLVVLGLVCAMTQTCCGRTPSAAAVADTQNEAPSSRPLPPPSQTGVVVNGNNNNTQRRSHPGGVPLYSIVFFVVCFCVGMTALGESVGYVADTSSRLTSVEFASKSCYCKTDCPHNSYAICLNECEDFYGRYQKSLHYPCVRTHPEFTFSDGFRCTVSSTLVTTMSNFHTPYPTQCALNPVSGDACASYSDSRQWWQYKLSNDTDFVRHLYRHPRRHVCTTKDKLESGIVTGAILLSFAGFFFLAPCAYFCS